MLQCSKALFFPPGCPFDLKGLHSMGGMYAELF